MRALVILLLLSINLLSQTKLKKDLFFPQKTEFPKNYKDIIGDPKGWSLIGYFNLKYDKVEYQTYPADSLHIFTPYQQGFMYLKIKGKKLLVKVIKIN